MAHGNAGALAGLFSTLLLYPLENIKIRMHENAGNSDHRSLLEVIKKEYENEGVKGFYKGVSALALGNYISYGVYFFWYEYFKHVFKTDITNPFKIIQPSLCSAILTSLVTNPFWVIQSRMTFAKDGSNFFRTTVKMVQSEGVLSIFKGLEASLILTINPIIQFFVYESIKHKFAYSEYVSLVNFLAGGISKAIATVLTYPYQLIRTKCHLARGQLSYVEQIRVIVEKEGVQGLFAGLSPKLC